MDFYSKLLRFIVLKLMEDSTFAWELHERYLEKWKLISTEPGSVKIYFKTLNERILG